MKITLMLWYVRPLNVRSLLNLINGENCNYNVVVVVMLR